MGVSAPAQGPLHGDERTGPLRLAGQCAVRRRVLCRHSSLPGRLRAALAVADVVTRGARRASRFHLWRCARARPATPPSLLGAPRCFRSSVCDGHARHAVRRGPSPAVRLSAAGNHLARPAGLPRGSRRREHGDRCVAVLARSACSSRDLPVAGIIPNQAAYIQPLAGGPRAAFAQYDLDYWGNCLLQGLTFVNEHEAGDRVYVSGWPLIVLQADLSRFPRLMLTEPTDPRATRFVTLARGSRTELLALAAFPGIESRISTADGALLCTVSGVAPPPMTPTLPHYGRALRRLLESRARPSRRGRSRAAG